MFVSLSVSVCVSVCVSVSVCVRACVCDFFMDYNTFDISDIINIHKYLVKKHNIKKYLD